MFGKLLVVAVACDALDLPSSLPSSIPTLVARRAAATAIGATVLSGLVVPAAAISRWEAMQYVRESGVIMTPQQFEDWLWKLNYDEEHDRQIKDVEEDKEETDVVDPRDIQQEPVKCVLFWCLYVAIYAVPPILKRQKEKEGS